MSLLSVCDENYYYYFFLYLSFHLLSSPTRLLMFYLDEKISFSQLFFFPIVKNSFLIFNKNSLNDFMISYIWYFLIEFSTLTSIQFMCCLLRQRCPIYVYDDKSMRDFSKILLLFFQVKVALILRAKKYFCFQFLICKNAKVWRILNQIH